MTLIQSEPKAIKIWTTDVKAVYLWENKVRPTTPATVTVTDSTNWYWWYTSYTGSYYQWVAFTALKTWKITKVCFIYNWVSSWTLKIAQWAFPSASWTTYSFTSSSSWEYTLTTPYDITEWTIYTISVSSWNAKTFWVWDWSLPITWTAVRFEYSSYSWYNDGYYNTIWGIKSLTIEYTP